MSIISDLFSILRSLSFIDYVLYFSVLALILLTTSLIYVLRDEKEIDEIELKEEARSDKMVKEQNEELDLQNIVNTIDENPEPITDMTAYEQEQEQKAIISYEELVKESQTKQISYDTEELVDDCIPVKKINVTSLLNETGAREPKEEISIMPSETPSLFHYEREEAFLKALQELNELLN